MKIKTDFFNENAFESVVCKITPSVQSLVYLIISYKGMNYWELSLLKSMLLDKHFQT